MCHDKRAAADKKNTLAAVVETSEANTDTAEHKGGLKWQSQERRCLSLNMPRVRST